MPLNRENRRRQITLNVTPYVYDVDAVALSLINQFKADGADPEVTKLDDNKLSLTFRESDELTYEVACQKILWNQYVQNIEQKNVTTNIELLKKMVDPFFESPVVANVNEVKGNGEGQLDGISPDAFNHGEVLFENGQPMAHPKYILDDSDQPDGPPLLTKDINKAVQPSTITAFKYANSEEMETHFADAINPGNTHHGNSCKFCKEPEYMSWEHQKIVTHPDAKLPDNRGRRGGRGYEMLKKHRENQYTQHDKRTCPTCVREEADPLGRNMI
jgi:hypothetical protein